MSAENLLVPLVIVVIFVALSLFALVFFANTGPEDSPAVSPVEPTPADESDTWYFRRFEPEESASDLSDL